jgi:outer membrane receptor for ferrienterochelin and colicin
MLSSGIKEMSEKIWNLTHKQRMCELPIAWILLVMTIIIGRSAGAGNNNIAEVESAVAVEPNAPVPVSQPTPPKGVNAPPPEEGSELMMFMDMPIVVSASRSEQPINWSPVPISVISAEDIHYSGATNVYEVLRYVPGVDVLKLSRYRYAVGVRGFHDFISDRTLTLIDGRAADSPLFGGSEFYRQPFLMEDIKQIEVVRGPGGAAWGANAFNGVINIITKKPEDCPKWFASTTWSEFGDSYNHVRWAEKKNNWQWMASAGYEDVKDSADAIHDPEFTSSVSPEFRQLSGFDNYTTRDFIRNMRFDGKAIYKSSPETDITFGSGYTQSEGATSNLPAIFRVKTAIWRRRDRL